MGHASDLHGGPDVNHLSGDVAEGEVADHHLLSLGGVCQAHVSADDERRPGYLREPRGTRHEERRNIGATDCPTSLTLSWLSMTPLGRPVVPEV